MERAELQSALAAAERLCSSDPSAAERELRRLMAEYPRETAVLSSLARLLHRQRRTAEAIPLMQAATEIAARPSLFNDLGSLQLAAGNRAAAIAAYRRAVQLDPKYTLGLFNLADVLSESGDLPEAIDLYRRALAIDSSSVDGHVGLAIALVRSGNATAAVAACRSALALASDKVPVLHAMAIAQSKSGDLRSAITIEQAALAQRPEFAKGWHALGNMLDDAGDADQAASAFQQALTLDPSLVEAEYDLAALTGTAPPPAMPRAYVQRFFDDFAPIFERRLVGELEYHVPEALRDLVESHLSGGAKLDIVDLGCGTGLVGKQFRDLAARLTGIDLSTAMLAAAEKSGVYDELHRGDVTEFLAARPSAYDLILAADLFIYIGELDGLFCAAQSSLRSGGRFAFSIETIKDRRFALRRTRRYAHSLAYIADLARRNRFATVDLRPLSIRRGEEGMVNGHVFLLERSGD